MISRRKFIRQIGTIGLGATTFSLISNQVYGNKQKKYMISRPKVLFFDVNETLLDLTAMKAVIASYLNGEKELLDLWFSTMLHHSLVMSAAGQYAHFGQIGAAALQMVGAAKGIHISKEEGEKAILQALRSLPPHPDVSEGLIRLKEAGFTLVSFTNSSKEGVKQQLMNANLLELFDERLSVEEVGVFKPFKEAYEWAARQMGVKAHEAMLIAAHGWDIAGALWAGWQAAFIHRPGKQLFPLAPQPQLQASDLKQIAELILKQ
ncbi:haloacid dehalogenase type II [Thermonema rossianum]|uniref:haloacid dehalogenase type II n=1 Tax=Thermonema rossianum TaxID=55505 RepID=UPI0005718C80|nr:haloacid dehalogenase type II [Thermonema rossianum]